MRQLSYMVKILVVFISVSCWLSASAYAQGSAAPATSSTSGDSSVDSVVNALDYPELQVVPRASDRLKMEAKEEGSGWATHWPIELSGLATLTVGAMASGQYRSTLSESEKNSATTASSVAMAVGGGWVVAGVLIGMQRSNRAGVEQISRIGGKDDRSLLLRERLAEESLERQARLMQPLKWASVITNFSLSTLTGIYLSDQGRIVAGVSAVLAFLPLMYEDRSIDVYNKHIEYKKKIYRPMSTLDFHLDPQRHVTPIAKLTWEF